MRQTSKFRHLLAIRRSLVRPGRLFPLKIELIVRQSFRSRLFSEELVLNHHPNQTYRGSVYNISEPLVSCTVWDC